MKEFQDTLLTIYTDEETLQSFLKNRKMFLEGTGLLEKERGALLSLSDEDLKRVAHDLRAKRMMMAQKIIGDTSDPTYKGVALFSAFKAGPAIVFFSKGKYEVLTISPGAYRLLSSLSKKKSRLTYMTLLQEYADQGRYDTTLTLSVFFSLVKVIVDHSLRGSMIFASL